MFRETEKLELENDDAEAIHAEVAASPRPHPRRDLQRGTFDVRSLALTGLFVLAVFYTMYFMRAVLLPLVLALLLSYLLRPLVRTLARARITPPVGAALVLLSLVGAIAYAVSFLATPAAGWIEKAPYSLQQLQWKLLPLKQPIESVAKASGEIEKLATSDNPQAKSAIEVKRHPITDALYVRAPELIVNAVMLLILLYFLLASDGVFLTKLIKLLPTLSDKKRAVSIANEIEAHVSRYLLTVTLINVSLGVALVFPAAYLSLAILEGNFITPLVMGRSLTLNPVMVLLSLIFWGWMWGIAGVILAVPILAAFKIFCAHLRPLEPMAEFLS